MYINKACLKLIDAFFEIEIEAFTNNKPTALFERQVALKKLKVEVLAFINERPDAMFTIKNTTANTGDFSNSITIKPYSQTRRRYEITLSQDCSSYCATMKD